MGMSEASREDGPAASQRAEGGPGIELAEPGVVAVAKWRPHSDVEAGRPSSMWCGVARKP
jgi:hypothetical protein